MEENDEDIWGRDEYCNACRVKCKDEAEKQTHRSSPIHIKKWNLHKFFTQDSVHHETIGVSEMLERYKLNKFPVIGLHQCQEVQQIGLSNQDKANFWTCNICYEAGATFQSADDHLNSMNHIRNYMDECECEEKEDIEKECENDECDKYERYCVAAQQIFQREGGIDGLQPPSILRMNFSTEDGMKRFGIDDVSEVTFQPCPGDDDHKILSCSTCNEVAPVHIVGKYTAERARDNHYEQPTHRTCATINSIINEFNPTEIYEDFDISQCSMELKWIEKDQDQWYLSQPCGYRYSIRAGKDGKETVCTVCYALVDTDKMIEHFSSEAHAMKYLNMIKPHSAYVAQQLSGAERRTKALTTLLSAYSLEMDSQKVASTLTRFPTAIKQKLSGDFHAYSDAPIEIIDDFKDTAGKVYRFCQLCTTFIEFDANMVNTPKRMAASWKSHVLSTAHFETAAIRARVLFDPSYFVPYSPTISNAEPDITGVWKVDNKNVLIQSQCDVGLEYMVEDEKANEVTCQCCWKVLSKNPAVVNQHVRSYDHLKQYIYVVAPDNVRILLGPEVDETKQEFMMNFLRRQSGVFPKRMNLYSKLKALELSSWTPVLRSLVQLSMKMENFDRDIFDTVKDLVDEIAGDGADMISAKEALLFTRMVIINTTRGADKDLGSVVCRCEDCGLLVIADAATWQRDIFDCHLCTEEHRKRTEVRKKHIINAYGIRPERSTYIVKPFVQKADNKKVVWQWNATTKKHEYVHGLVGLEDIIECRVPDDRNIAGIETKTVFFCTLCATILQKRGDQLALHMREMSHCINWVHKHRPTHIRELSKHITNDVDKGKELRKFLQTLLKDVYSPADYCMLAYDPDGVEKDMQNEIKQKIEAEKKRKKMEAGREKAAAEKERKRLEKEARDLEMEEHRRLARLRKQEDEQRHLEKSKARMAEDAARLDYAQKNVHKYRQQTPEEIAFNKRLNGNSMLEQQKNAERQSIDIQKAKLEAERRKLLSASQSATTTAPKLVVFPQLKSQPTVAHNPYGVLPTAPPVVSHAPETLRFNLTQQIPQQATQVPFFGPPPPAAFQQNRPPPILPMSLSHIAHQDLPAYVKRPSLRGQRVDPVIHDTTRIKNKADLIEYMKKQGANSIVDQSELPHELSQRIEDHPDAFGVKYVTEIVCLDDPSLDSYVCSLCKEWCDSNGILNHLCSTEHKSQFLCHDYRPYYDEVLREKDPNIRRTIFKNFTQDLKKQRVGDVITLRMSTLIDRATIARLWPGYEEHFNKKASSGSWSAGGFKPVAGPSVILPDAVKVPALIDNDDMEVDSKEVSKKKYDTGRDRRRDRSRSRNRSRRSRSREDRRRRSRSRSRSRSRDRYYRDRRDRRSRSRTRSRSRSRSRSRDRRESRPSRSRQNTLVDQTDTFLAKLKDGTSSSAPKPIYPSLAKVNIPSASPVIPTQVPQMTDFNAKLATVRNLTQSGVIKGSQIDTFVPTNVPPPAIIAPTHSTDNRILETKRQEEETGRKQKQLATMLGIEELIAKYGQNVPRHLVIELYSRFGFDEITGDRAVEDFIVTHKLENNSPTGISNLISSYGIGTKTTQSQQYQHPPPVQQQQPPSHPQYGISSQTPANSAYSQVFGNQPLSQSQPTGQTATQPFYKDPPTSMNYGSETSSAAKTDNKPDEPASNDSSDDEDDDDYQDIYQAIRKQKPPAEKHPKEAKEVGILPGQKMALNRTILPNGARVGEQLPVSTNPPSVAQVAAQSPTPSDSSSIVVITSNSTPVKSLPQVPPASQAGRPALASSLGMPAPIAVTKVVQQTPPQQQMVYQSPQQGYPPMNPSTSQYPQQPLYQQPGQYPQQLYQQPPQPQQPSQYAQQYGIQQPAYQQQPPHHHGFHQTVYQPPQPQYPQQQQQQYPPQPQYQPPPQQQPYYQQNPPVQQPPAGGPPVYGIGGTQQQYYWQPQ